MNLKTNGYWKEIGVKKTHLNNKKKRRRKYYLKEEDIISLDSGGKKTLFFIYKGTRWNVDAFFYLKQNKTKKSLF